MSGFVQPLLSAIAAFVTAAVGAWVGAHFALSRFRRERTFDRQLDWCERMVRSLFALGEAIEIALTFHSEGHGAQKWWDKAGEKHLDVDRFAREAQLYGSLAAIVAAQKAQGRAQMVANETAAFVPAALPPEEQDRAIELLRHLPEQLYDDARPIIEEARRHLGLESIATPSPNMHQTANTS